MAKQNIDNAPGDIIANYMSEMAGKAKHLEVGPPVDLNPQAFQELLDRLHGFRDTYTEMSFWFVVNFNQNTFNDSEGLEAHFNKKIDSRSDFLLLIHPDYVLSYFRWVLATVELILKIKDNIKPLQGSVRISIPLCNHDGIYFWYSQHTTITQQDAQGNVITYLNTYYREERWSPLILKPFATYLQLPQGGDNENEQALNAIMAPYIIDEFTNSELEVIHRYAAGMNAIEVANEIGWSKHTLNEYNVNILKKARRLFQYSFRSAREFSLYCLEKGFIYKR